MESSLLSDIGPWLHIYVNTHTKTNDGGQYIPVKKITRGSGVSYDYNIEDKKERCLATFFTKYTKS